MHCLLSGIFQDSTLRNRTAESNELFLYQDMICTPKYHTAWNLA